MFSGGAWWHKHMSEPHWRHWEVSSDCVCECPGGGLCWNLWKSIRPVKKPLGNKHLAIIYKIQLLQLLFSVFRYYGSCVICEEVSSLFAWKKVLKELCSAHEQRTWAWAQERRLCTTVMCFTSALLVRQLQETVLEMAEILRLCIIQNVLISLLTCYLTEE